MALSPGSRGKVNERRQRTEHASHKEDQENTHGARTMAAVLPSDQICVASAGVLCFSRRTDGKLVVLLGREKETAGWKQGSNKWSGFSGRIEQGEDLYDGAAREFVEESLAVVPFDNDKVTSARKVSDVLRGQGGAGWKVELYMRVSPPLTHVSFVQGVPFADYPSRFRALRAVLSESDSRFRAFHKIKKAAEGLPRLLFPGYRLSPSLTVTSGRRVKRKNIVLSLWDSILGKVVEHELALASSAAAKEAGAVYEAWEEVLYYLERNKQHGALQHPAVCLQLAGPHVVGAFVNKCYMEKSEIRWWGLEELEHAARTRPHEFRRFFGDALPDLMTAVRSAAERLDKE